ncbi:hypothetical protein PoB_002484800 [Plakobranchus ocellatus]|uniref:Uncharacterized protein n=1 Tax=Plakobranchus ocellatus TaxID=259542 RepID=A0AAV3ZU00_9GAST|nr:hypothetical protein PoB_002484800 [Plakobranchus ocellatus]
MVLHFFLSFVTSIASNDFPAFSQSARPLLLLPTISLPSASLPGLIEGLADWLKAGKSLEAIEATKDRKKWRTMIANAVKQGT